MGDRTIVVREESQAIPALASFFVPGLGQLIQGRVMAALVWFLVIVLAAGSIIAFIGILLYPMVVILCTIDAAKYTPPARTYVA